MQFIRVTVKNHEIMHGFDENNKEMLERVEVAKASTKLVAVDRILSIGEKFILISYADGRIIYWEYSESFEDIQEQLKKKGLLI